MSLLAAPLVSRAAALMVSLAAALSCPSALDVATAAVTAAAAASVADVVSGSLQCLLPFLGMHEAKDLRDARPRLGRAFAKLRCNVKAL